MLLSGTCLPRVRGADIDLVGPGAAYERWKKTPEYQQWLKESGQLTKRLHFLKLDGMRSKYREKLSFAILAGHGAAHTFFWPRLR